MTKNYFIIFLLLIYGNFASGQNSRYSSSVEQNLYAGVSKINITPKTPIPIAWHAGKNRVYDGIHDEVFIRAIIFSNGKTKAALIAADASEFSSSFNDEIFERIEKETGMSSTTIARVNKWLTNGKGGYKLMLKRLKM